jgi:hypothetical protein
MAGPSWRGASGIEGGRTDATVAGAKALDVHGVVDEASPDQVGQHVVEKGPPDQCGPVVGFYVQLMRDVGPLRIESQKYRALPLGQGRLHST